MDQLTPAKRLATHLPVTYEDAEYLLRLAKGDERLTRRAIEFVAAGSEHRIVWGAALVVGLVRKLADEDDSMGAPSIDPADIRKAVDALNALRVSPPPAPTRAEG